MGSFVEYCLLAVCFLLGSVYSLWELYQQQPFGLRTWPCWSECIFRSKFSSVFRLLFLLLFYLTLALNFKLLSVAYFTVFLAFFEKDAYQNESHLLYMSAAVVLFGAHLAVDQYTESRQAELVAFVSLVLANFVVFFYFYLRGLERAANTKNFWHTWQRSPAYLVEYVLILYVMVLTGDAFLEEA